MRLSSSVTIAVLLFFSCFIVASSSSPLNSSEPSPQSQPSQSTLTETSINIDGEIITTSSYPLPSKPPPSFKHNPLIYGTAWKKEDTTNLVSAALLRGFRRFDTANQFKHYREDLVYWGLARGMTFINEENGGRGSGIKRKEIWIQTKFTPIGGQDPEHFPYDGKASLEDQVQQSIDGSLNRMRSHPILKNDDDATGQLFYIDSLLLHSSMLTPDNLRVWGIFEKAAKEGKVKALGISNFYDLDELHALWNFATIKPTVLQNRFRPGLDPEIRSFCLERGIEFQSFWTLTTNRHLLTTTRVRELAFELKFKTTQLMMLAYMLSLSITPISGTTDVKHMVEDNGVSIQCGGEGEGNPFNFGQGLEIGKELSVILGVQPVPTVPV
jgi:diketogulonate reductase-like aldo/keto reductase